MNLGGKTALITGSSRGIGKGIAVEFAKEGVSIGINYINHREAAEETAEIIRSSGGYAEIFQGDISSYKNAEEMISRFINKFGRLDILVNNAGVSSIGLFTDMKEKNWEDIINVNVKGVFNCSHCALKYMLEKKSGNIINISSIWGNVGASCEVVYSATKGAINSFTRALAKEMAPSGIRVNAISPGVIHTEMNDWLSDSEKEALLQEIPLMRFGKISDVGRLAVFLASDDSDYITGQVITIDGGML